MMDRIYFEKNGIEDLKKIVDEDLYHYSCEGYRTLLFAQRSIIKEEYQTFKRLYNNLQMSSNPSKESKLFELYDQMEQKLRYVGCSAIEDKLQDGVAITISKLMQADVKFFMLTGDKLETAIEIAKSCQVIQDDMKVIVLGKKQKESLEDFLRNYVDENKIEIGKEVKSLKDVQVLN